MRTAEDIVREKNRDILAVSADTLIYEALQVMVEHKVGAIMIEEDQKIVGVWTERDLMRNTLEKGFDPRTAAVGDYMVTKLHSAPHTDSVYNLMDKFLGLRVRHLPIEKHGEYIGLLSIGDVIRANLYEKTRELEALNAVVGWEYYEQWNWTSLAQAQKQAARELARPKDEITT